MPSTNVLGGREKKLRADRFAIFVAKIYFTNTIKLELDTRRKDTRWKKPQPKLRQNHLRNVLVRPSVIARTLHRKIGMGPQDATGSVSYVQFTTLTLFRTTNAPFTESTPAIHNYACFNQQHS